MSKFEVNTTLCHRAESPPSYPVFHLSLNGVNECAYYTLSGRIGKVVAEHAAVARSIPAEVSLIYTMHEGLRGHCP